MAQNEVSPTGKVLYQVGDDLSEPNLSETAAQGNQTNYVERGLSVTHNSTVDTIDIGGGHVIIEDANEAFDVFPDQETDISLPNGSGDNFVFASHDPTTDDSITYHVDDDETAPSDPSLLIAIVDTATDIVTEINRAPTVTLKQQRFETREIDDTDSPYTTRGESAIYADTSTGAVTIELSSADAIDGTVVEIYDVGENASQNNITVQTEASENINPGANSSITLTVDGSFIKIRNRAGSWFTDRRAERELVQTENLGHDGSDVQVDDDLDLQGNQDIKNAKSIETENLGHDGSDVQVDDDLNLQGNQDIKNAKSIETENLGADGSDAQVDDDLDLQGTLTNSDVAKGSTKLLYGGLAANDHGGELRTHPEDGVGTTATTILNNTRNGPDILTALVVIVGDRQGSSNRFYEIVHYGRNNVPQIINSIEFNAPDGRSYSRENADLQLAMAANTYDVTATAIVARRDKN